MPLPNVTIRAARSRRVSVTNPGTSRVCRAPISRMADQTSSVRALVTMCLQMEPTVTLTVTSGATKAGQPEFQSLYGVCPLSAISGHSGASKSCPHTPESRHAERQHRCPVSAKSRHHSGDSIGVHSKVELISASRVSNIRLDWPGSVPADIGKGPVHGAFVLFIPKGLLQGRSR